MVDQMKHFLSVLCGLLEAKKNSVDFASGRDTNPNSKAAPFQNFGPVLNPARHSDSIYLAPSVWPLNIRSKLKISRAGPIA